MVAVVFPALWWFLIFAMWVLFLWLTMGIAASKGHTPWLWGLLACFIPFITVIIVLLLPDKSGTA